MILTTDQLAEQLRWMANRVELHDSFEGNFTYVATDTAGQWQVDGAIRFGNSEGQGSIRLYKSDPSWS